MSRPWRAWRRPGGPASTALLIVAALLATATSAVACAGSPGSGPGGTQAGGAQPGGAGGPLLSSPGASAPAGAASASATPSATATPAPPPTSKPPVGGAPAHFGTLPPGAVLPSGAQCAAWVRAKSYPENKGGNRQPNQNTGAHLGANFFSGDDARANTTIAPRVDGQFTGTTRQILRWAACKWGIDEDLVFAQAAIESWWQQGTLGDWTTDASRCAPGRGLGVDGRAGQCPESFGILQNRYPYEQSSWPGIASSTAMNADLAYAIWRTCFQGYEGWLNTVERGSQYVAGDAWGCIGRWFSGRWHTDASEQYATRVRGYLDQRIWETANFQQP